MVCVYIYIKILWYVYIYTMEYHSAIKKNEISTSENMNGPKGYYANWNKSDKETEILYDLTYIANLKNENKWTNIAKQKQTHIYREWVGVRREACWWKSEIDEGYLEIQTSSYKINKPLDIMYRLGNIVNNIIITLYCDRWELDLWWWSFYHVSKHQITMLYLWN